MIRWTGLAPWEFELPFSGSLTSTFLSITRNPKRQAKDLAKMLKEGAWDSGRNLPLPDAPADGDDLDAKV